MLHQVCQLVWPRTKNQVSQVGNLQSSFCNAAVFSSLINKASGHAEGQVTPGEHKVLCNHVNEACRFNSSVPSTATEKSYITGANRLYRFNSNNPGTRKR